MSWQSFIFLPLRILLHCGWGPALKSASVEPNRSASNECQVCQFAADWVPSPFSASGFERAPSLQKKVGAHLLEREKRQRKSQCRSAQKNHVSRLLWGGQQATQGRLKRKTPSTHPGKPLHPCLRLIQPALLSPIFPAMPIGWER